jgi:hypothetical protein
MAPKDTLPSFSNTGLQVVPAFSVFHAPPEADAAKMTRVSRGSTAKAVILPLVIVGPSSRQARALRSEDRRVSPAFCA